MDADEAEHDSAVGVVDLLSSLIVGVLGAVLLSWLLLLLAVAWMGLALAQLRLGLRVRQLRRS